MSRTSRKGKFWGQIACPICDEPTEYSGYYDPGCFTGHPDNWYPNESDIEVIVHEACHLSEEQISDLDDKAWTKVLQGDE